jgi:hypothetical protein
MSSRPNDEHYQYLHDQGFEDQITDLRITKMVDLLEISKLYPNLKRLQAKQTCCINHTKPFILARLLDGPFSLKFLTSLTMDFSNPPYKAVIESKTCIEQLQHAPAFEYLTMSNVYIADYGWLDLLNENTPNLKHLELGVTTYPLITAFESNAELKYECLDLHSSNSKNLRFLSLSHLRMEEMDVNFPIGE